ncbi:unnamed protein product [Spirodela intermedia]|uniref:non-specific serine/threonine protein kinase n=1 Tax=Spirodela intermedia TaxID=51605 RepID=A0A7I8JJA2_SPIIN|nr:unnamed protein product [Spirodela intermedia]CAA6670248.1 unnamed protein product [Spirodela intermedia]
MVRQEEEGVAGGGGERKVLFGKYQMGRLLGKGTFAKVYYGKELSSGESVAIKVINKEQVKREPQMVAQIVREISIMRLVRHPHVVELREVMATKSRIFFVMEYIRGGELFARVARGKLCEDDARRYFQQLISAVDFCHSRGVSHRDIKPENLLLDENGGLKVSDFGLSALPEQLRQDGMLHTQWHAGVRGAGGPAQEGYDGGAADLWSCGVVLFVLLAGFLPFQDENLMKMYRKVFKAQFELPRWFSHGASRLVSRLLVPDPEKRITVPEIMEDPWFKTGFSLPAGDGGGDGGEKQGTTEGEATSPPVFFNAFELISAMSSGFDLSGLFEEEKSPRQRAATGSRLERVGRALGFAVKRGGGVCKLRLEGGREGRKGKLAVTAEVFELAPAVAVVEFCKSAGDTLEYVKFCEEDVRPGLKDMVWAWQGDHCNDARAGEDGAAAADGRCNSCGA